MDKRVIGLFLFLIIGILFGSCNTTSTNETKSFSFVFYDVFEQDTLIVFPDWVEINGIPIPYTVTSGYSVNIESGAHQILANSPDHAFLDTLITIDKNINAVSFKLESNKIAYFNTKVGERWVFEYEDYIAYPNSDRIITTGTMEWRVIEQREDESSGASIFTVKNDLEAIKKRENLGGEPIDSSYIDDTSYFTITLHENGNVSYSRVKFVHSFTSGISAINLNGDEYKSPVQQSYPKSRIKNNTVIDITYGSGSPYYRSSIAPNAGFIDFYMYNGGNTKTSTSLDLISHSK